MTSGDLSVWLSLRGTTTNETLSITEEAAAMKGAVSVAKMRFPWYQL